MKGGLKVTDTNLQEFDLEGCCEKNGSQRQSMCSMVKIEAAQWDAEQSIMRPGVSRGWSLGLQYNGLTQSQRPPIEEMTRSQGPKRYDRREVEVERDQGEVEVWCTTNMRGQIVELRELRVRDLRKFR